MATGDFRIRSMTRDEIGFAVELAAREGWNPGLHDAHSFHAADPGAFLIALLESRPIGCISAVSYPGSFGFIGLYIVVPELRGRGYGLRLWQTAMTRLNGYNIGLDGVVEQQPSYQRSGFRLAYNNIRFEHNPGAATAPPDDEALTDAAQLPLESLADYDRRCFPAPRQTFLRAWLSMPESSASAWVEQDAIRGYGVIRRCRKGHKIGPLFADDPAIADALFRVLSARAEPGEPVYLDVPQPNADGLQLVRRYGMEEVFRTARMYTGEPPDIELASVYGVTSFELG